jgi:HK97 gp10 family phage protein
MSRLLSGRYDPNFKLDLKEVKEFENKLQLLYGMTVKERRNELQKVTNYALRDTKKAMISLAPKGKTGSLKKSISTNKAVATGFGSVVGSRTGPIIRGKGKRRAFHAHLVELGTKRKVKRLKKGIGFGAKPFTFYSVRYGKVLRRAKINHGSRARPFVKPAIAKTKHDYPRRIAKKMDNILKGLAAKMKK